MVHCASHLQRGKTANSEWTVYSQMKTSSTSCHSKPLCISLLCGIKKKLLRKKPVFFVQSSNIVEQRLLLLIVWTKTVERFF